MGKRGGGGGGGGGDEHSEEQVRVVGGRVGVAQVGIAPLIHYFKFC